MSITVKACFQKTSKLHILSEGNSLRPHKNFRTTHILDLLPQTAIDENRKSLELLLETYNELNSFLLEFYYLASNGDDFAQLCNIISSDQTLKHGDECLVIVSNKPGDFNGRSSFEISPFDPALIQKKECFSLGKKYLPDEVWFKILTLNTYFNVKEPFIKEGRYREKNGDQNFVSSLDIVSSYRDFLDIRPLKHELQENEMECGATCLFMITSQFEEVERYKYRNLILPTKAGSSIADIIKASAANNYKSCIVKSDFRHSPFGLVPFIALTDYHFVVVTKIDEQRIHFLDPGLGKTSILISAAQSNWTGYCIGLAPDFNSFKKRTLIIEDVDNVFEWDFKKTFFYIFLLILFISGMGYFDKRLVRSMLNFEYSQYLFMAFVLYIVISVGELGTIILGFSERNILNKRQLLSLSRFQRAVIDTASFYQKIINPKDFLSRVDDVSRYLRTFLSIPMRFCSKLLVLVMLCFLLFEMSPYFFLIVLVATALEGSMIFLTKKYHVNFSQMLNDKSNNYEYLLTEYLQGLKSIIALKKCSNAQENTFHRFMSYLEVEKLQIYFHNRMGFFIQAIDRVALLSTISLALDLYFKGILGVGDIIIAVTITMGITDPIINFVIQSTELLELASVRQRVLGLASYPKNTNNKLDYMSQDFCDFNIEVTDLNYGYPGVNGDLVLRNISKTIRSGKIYALVGASGSGKSTLGQLLSGQFSNFENSTMFKVTGISVKELMSSCLLLTGDDPALSASAIQNFKMGRENGNYDGAIEYLKMVWNDEAIDFEQLLFMNLDSTQYKISSGQLQRILFARAIFHQPKLLILDECFSSIDIETEEHIVSSLKQYLPHSLVVFITHRVALTKYADDIILLNFGSIESTGRGSDLFKESCLFRNLYIGH